MIINIVDGSTIEVFGRTSTKAKEDARDLIRFIGIDRWKSLSGLQSGREAGSDFHYKYTVIFDRPAEETK